VGVPKSVALTTPWETTMAWKTPKIVEIALGAEINCYACAELRA
jgi:coenzyme PQQ precursor peptide PqqA